MKKIKQLLGKIRLDKPVIIIASVGVFLLLNMLASGFSWRADFSQGKAYTLSPATKKVIRQLDDVVTVKFYVSSDLPATLTPAKMSVEDFLKEYKTAGGNRVIVKILDPKKDTATAKEVQELQIPELQFSQLENDKYQISSAYFAIGVFYGNKKDVLPQATDLSNLEYNVTATIYKLTKKELDRVAVAGIDEGGQQNDPYMPFRNTISKQFLTTYIDLNSDKAADIGKTYKTMVVIDANQMKFSEEALARMRRYLAEKGKIIVLADGVTVNENLTTAAAEHNLFSFLKEEGIELNKNLVLSTSAEFVNFGNDLYQYLSPYPFWVKATNFNTKTDYFSNISQLTFPWTSSVTLNAKAKGTTLVMSPKVSWQQKDTFELYPQKIAEPAAKDITQFPLIASVTTASGGALMVVPSSRFVDARYLSQNSGNIEFIFNALNNLASGGALAGIRSRSLSFHQLPTIPDSQKEVVKYTTIAILPVLFGIYGAIRLLRRK